MNERVLVKLIGQDVPNAQIIAERARFRLKKKTSIEEIGEDTVLVIEDGVKQDIFILAVNHICDIDTEYCLQLFLPAQPSPA